MCITLVFMTLMIARLFTRMVKNDPALLVFHLCLQQSKVRNFFFKRVRHPKFRSSLLQCFRQKSDVFLQYIYDTRHRFVLSTSFLKELSRHEPTQTWWLGTSRKSISWMTTRTSKNNTNNKRFQWKIYYIQHHTETAIKISCFTGYRLRWQTCISYTVDSTNWDTGPQFQEKCLEDIVHHSKI